MFLPTHDARRSTTSLPRLFLKVAAPATVQSFLRKKRPYLEEMPAQLFENIENLSSVEQHKALLQEAQKLRQDPQYHARADVYNRRYHPQSRLSQAFRLTSPIDIVYAPQADFSGRYYERKTGPSRIVTSHRSAPTLLHELGHASIHQDPWKMQRMNKLRAVMSEDRYRQLEERMANARVRNVLRQNPELVYKATGVNITPEEYMRRMRYSYGTYQTNHLARALQSIDQGTYDPRHYSYSVRQLANAYQQSRGTPDKTTPKPQQPATTSPPAALREPRFANLRTFLDRMKGSFLAAKPAVSFVGNSLLAGVISHLLLKQIDQYTKSTRTTSPTAASAYLPYPA